MAKPKSAKLRTLIALRALYKYTDKTHRMNSLQLNEYFRPYGLECSAVFLSHLVHAMQDYGIKVYQSGAFEKRGVFLEERPLSEEQLDQLIFAVSTNPHLPREQATKILQNLEPFVTVFQEPLLCGCVETDPVWEMDESLPQTFSTVQKAISTKRRIVFRVDRLKYNAEEQMVEKAQRIKMRFTPRYLYQTQGRLYMIGYNSTKKVFEAVDLKDITYIAPAMQHTDPFADQIDHYFSSHDPKELIPERKQTVLYEGEAVFRFHGLYDMDLFRRFGPPTGPVVRDDRCRVTYSVTRITLTTDDLHWLSRFPGHGVRIIGPEPLVHVVRNYHLTTAAELVNPVISREYRKRHID